MGKKSKSILKKRVRTESSEEEEQETVKQVKK